MSYMNVHSGKRTGLHAVSLRKKAFTSYRQADDKGKVWGHTPGKPELLLDLKPVRKLHGFPSALRSTDSEP